MEENAGVEFCPVDHTNDERNVAGEDSFGAINATLEVDFLGQCASESLGSEYWSSSGGQPDFARGAILSEHGQSFIVGALDNRGRVDLPRRGAASSRRGGHHVQERS